VSGARVSLIVDGESVSVEAGVTVAAALLNAGRTMFRRSIVGEPRGPVCGMGVCYECRVTIDGALHQRACLRVAVEGMHVDTGVGDEVAIDAR
jgi:D-hydroxyproline dehydrogenase subunit gamma